MAQNFCENVFPIEWKQGTDNVRWNLCLIFVRKQLWTGNDGGHKAPFHPGHDGGGLDHAIKDRSHGVTCNCTSCRGDFAKTDCSQKRIFRLEISK